VQYTAVVLTTARKDFGVVTANQGNRLLGGRRLRITIDEGEESVVLRIEGQLISPCLAEVEQCSAAGLRECRRAVVADRPERREFRGHSW
jgi:hypothetical protein